MACDPSDRLLRQVHRLFSFGAVGTMSEGDSGSDRVPI